jgi:hypothetical protein
VKPATLQWKSHYAPGEPIPVPGASPIPFTAGPPPLDPSGGNYDECDGTHEDEYEEREGWLAASRGPSVATDLMAAIKAELGR